MLSLIYFFFLFFRSRQRGISHIWKRIGACSNSVSPMFGDRSLESSRCISVIFDLFDFLYKYAVDFKMAQDNNPETQTIQSVVNGKKKFIFLN